MQDKTQTSRERKSNPEQIQRNKKTGKKRKRKIKIWQKATQSKKNNERKTNNMVVRKQKTKQEYKIKNQ